MTEYKCVAIVNNDCVHWVEVEPNYLADVMRGLSMLTLADVTQITIATATLFAVCWVFRELPFFTKQK